MFARTTISLICVTVLFPFGKFFAPAQPASRPKDAPTAETTIAKLIEDLGDPRFKVRDSASQRLLSIGEPALPLLLKAKDSPDEEVRERADHLIPKIVRLARTQSARRLLARIGDGGLGGLIERMVKNKDADTPKNWQMLEELVPILSERAPAAKLGPPWKWSELVVDRDFSWKNCAEKRYLIPGLTKSPLLVERAVIVSDGSMTPISTIVNSVFIVRGSLKGCTRLESSLVICLGDFGGASVIESSVVIATGKFGGTGLLDDSLILAGGDMGKVERCARSTINPDDALLDLLDELLNPRRAAVNPKALNK